MQVRRSRICISRGSNKPDDVPTLDPHSLPEPFRVPVQVRVVVAVHSHFIELVDSGAAWFAEEQLSDGSGYHGMYGCPSGLQNVDRLMPMSVVNFFESILQISEGQPADGQCQIWTGRSRCDDKKQ